jgi:hypothetical protein
LNVRKKHCTAYGIGFRHSILKRRKEYLYTTYDSLLGLSALDCALAYYTMRHLIWKEEY